MSEPLVSVLMNCYNGEKFLHSAVQSVLAQTWQNWEVIFWDNQSTDNSAAVFKSFRDPRLRYFYAPAHTGLYEARALAVKHASGSFVAFLDVDDAWLPSKLERQIPLFADEEVAIVCSNYFIESQSGNRRWLAHSSLPPTGYVLDALLTDYFVGLVTLVVRRSALDALGQTFSKEYNIIGDFDVVIRLAERWKLDYVNIPTATYLIHGSNTTITGRAGLLNELRRWRLNIRNSTIRDRLALSALDQNLIYLEAVGELLNGNRWTAVSCLRYLPLGACFFKVLGGALLPTKLMVKIKAR